MKNHLLNSKTNLLNVAVSILYDYNIFKLSVVICTIIRIICDYSNIGATFFKLNCDL